MGIFSDKGKETKKVGAVRKWGEKFQNLAESLNEVVYLADPKTFETIYINRAVEMIFGYSVEEWLKNPNLWEDSIHPDEREKVLDEVNECVRKGEKCLLEHRIVRKDGTTGWVVDHFGFQRDAEGGVESIIGVVYDVTERKKAEMSVRRQANEMENMLEASQRLTTTLDLGTLLQISIDETVKITGLGSGAIYLIEDNNMLKLWATTPPLPPDFPEDLRLMPMDDHPHIKKSITTKRPVILADTAKSSLTPAEQAVTKLRGLRTLLYVPLLGDEKVLGIFIVGSVGEPCAISEDQVHFSSAIANQTALAVKNVKLYEEKSKKVEELEKWQRLTIDREVKMVELKNEIKELKKKLKNYKST
jgi:PAS domain S-box-containing protein